MKTKKIAILILLPLLLTCFLSVGQFQLANADITTGLIGYWNLDEGSGTVTIDQSGNNYHGTIVNSQWIETGKFLSCLSFDGDADYVHVDTMDGYFNGSQGLSLSAWVNFTVSQDNVNVVGWWHSDNVKIAIASDKFYFVVSTYVNHDVGVLSQNIYNDGIFHLVTGVYNSSHLEIYVDGVLDNTIEQTGEVDSQDRLAFASFQSTDGASGAYFTGMIDDVRIYNRVLSSSDVAELYIYDPNYVEPTPSPSPTATSTPSEWTTTITFAFIGLILLIIISLYFIIRPLSYVNVIVGIFLLSYTLTLLTNYSEIHWVFALFATVTGIITIVRSTNWSN